MSLTSVGAAQSPTRRLIVIGGGLSGLSAAYQAIQASKSKTPPWLEVVLLEATDRVGGAIWTTVRDGFTIEGGADSFITDKPPAIELCHELGLAEQLISPDAGHRRSFVVRDGRLYPIPEGFVLMAPRKIGPLLRTPILSPWGKLRLFMDYLLPPRTASSDADESLASFVRRRLGCEALERLVQPLVGGIYTADPRDLSLRATLPRFLEMERQHGGLIRGGLRQAKQQQAASAFRSGPDPSGTGARYGLFASLTEGMETLPRAIAQALPGGTIRLNSPVRRITRGTGVSHNQDHVRPWLVELRDGPQLEADALVLATEAHASARLVDGFDPDLATMLREIPYASSAIVSLAFDRDQIAHPLDGFGVVVPQREGRSILAASFLSVKFPRRAPEKSVVIRTFLGGATQPELFEHDDEELVRIVRAELRSLLGARGEPRLVQVDRHARAMPQYTLGHLDRVAAIIDRVRSWPDLVLTGSAFTGVGVPDCIGSARRAIEALADSLAQRDGSSVAA